jgi:hypothetical protein
MREPESYKPKRCLCRHALPSHGRNEAGGWNPVCRGKDCPCSGYETVEIKAEREALGPPYGWRAVKSIRINGGYVGQ